jgi:hypothetical protein
MMAPGVALPSPRAAQAAGSGPLAGLRRRKCACGASHRPEECEHCRKVRRSLLVGGSLLRDAPEKMVEGVVIP